MKVLVGCESSGTVREAFRKLGHDAWSNDLLDADDNSPFHIKGDVFDAIKSANWDLGIFHLPCTYLTVSAGRWLYHPEDRELPQKERRQHPLYPNRRQDQLDAVEFVKRLMEVPFAYAIENPVGHLSTAICKPTQIIQPCQFGHPTTKKTCLWLKGVSPLKPTKIVEPEYGVTKSGRKWDKWWLETSSLPLSIRWKVRSKTFQGIADAMADQWGGKI